MFSTSIRRRRRRLLTHRTSAGFTLVELLIVVAIIGLLVSLTIPAVQSAKRAGKKAACSNNIRQLGIALEAHQSDFLAFPVDGVNGYGIGAFLLPFLEEKSLYQELRPTQRAFSAEGPVQTQLAVFHCPSAGGKDSATTGLGRSNYIGIQELFETRTIFDDITDGASNTIAMGETLEGHAWAAPGLASASSPNSGGSFGSRHPLGANFVFCDGSVHFILDDVDPDVFAALCTISGGEIVSDY